METVTALSAQQEFVHRTVMELAQPAVTVVVTSMVVALALMVFVYNLVVVLNVYQVLIILVMVLMVVLTVILPLILQILVLLVNLAIPLALLIMTATKLEHVISVPMVYV